MRPPGGLQAKGNPTSRELFRPQLDLEKHFPVFSGVKSANPANRPTARKPPDGWTFVYDRTHARREWGHWPLGREWALSLNRPGHKKYNSLFEAIIPQILDWTIVFCYYNIVCAKIYGAEPFPREAARPV